MKSTKLFVALMLATLCVASMEAGKKRSTKAAPQATVFDVDAAFYKTLRAAKTVDDKELQTAYNDLRSAAEISNQEYLMSKAESEMLNKFKTLSKSDVTAARAALKAVQSNFVFNEKAIPAAPVTRKEMTKGEVLPKDEWKKAWGDEPAWATTDISTQAKAEAAVDADGALGGALGNFVIGEQGKFAKENKDAILGFLEKKIAAAMLLYKQEDKDNKLKAIAKKIETAKGKEWK